jgi:hypothetical protein
LATSKENGKIYDKIQGTIKINNCKNCFIEMPFSVIKLRKEMALLNQTKQIKIVRISKKYCKFCLRRYF